MENDGIDALFGDTSEASRLKLISELYDNLTARQKDFCDSFCIQCDHGCGECCEHFHPDVTDLEAEFLAYGLVKNNLDEAVLKQLASWDNSNYCPLYNKASDFHCRVYGYRPLVCRLFGSSAVTDKNGKLKFRKCKWSSVMKDLGADVLEPAKEHVVNMSDFGIQLEEDEPGESQTYPLTEAIPKAVQKIRFLISLKQQEG